MKKFIEYKTLDDAAKAHHLPESEIRHMKMQSSLVVAIQKKIKKEGLTHLEAAQRTGFGRTVITAVMNGNILNMSTDRLIQIAEGLGLKVTLKVA